MKRVLVLLVLSVGLIGCGAPKPELESESEKVNRALGGSEDDVAAFERWLDTVQPVADHDIAVMKAFMDEDYDVAQVSIDRMHRASRDSRAIAQDVRSERLRTFLVAYSGRIQGVADAYQAIVDAPADVTNAEIRVLGKRLGRSEQRLAALDRRFLAVYKKVLSAARYKELQEHAKDVRERADEAREG